MLAHTYPNGRRGLKNPILREVSHLRTEIRQVPSASTTTICDLTVNEVILRYWQFAQTYYVKNGQPTDEQYGIRAALRSLRQLYGHTPARDFGPGGLKLVREAMIDAGHSRKYINDNVNRIRRTFKWAVAEELVPPSIHQALQAVTGLKAGRSAAREPEPIGPASEERVEMTLPLVSSQVAAMIQLQLLSGARPGEIRTGGHICSTASRRSSRTRR